MDTTGWAGAPENLSMLPIVQETVSRDRKLAFRYSPAGRGKVQRTVDHLGLVAMSNPWYVVVRAPDAYRTYRYPGWKERGSSTGRASVRRISISPPTGNCPPMS